MKPRRASVPVIALTAAALLASGLSIGLFLSPTPASQAAVQVAAEADLPAVSDQFDDAQQVTFAPIWSEAINLNVAAPGRITRIECAPGQEITSGTSPITVNDQPIIALATDIPLWRDLGPGSRGDDVRALQKELLRLGYPVSTDGFYGAATADAVRDLFTRAGQLRPTGSVSAERVLWLSAPEVTVDQCGLANGDQSDAGPFATSNTQLIGLQISSGTDDALPGARSVRFAGVTAPLTELGTVTDPGLLDAVQASGWFTSGLEANTIDLDYFLTAPLSVLVVPPGALFGFDGSSACLIENGNTWPVQIVASRLGRTMVELVDQTGVAPSVVQIPPPNQSCP